MTKTNTKTIPQTDEEVMELDHVVETPEVIEPVLTTFGAMVEAFRPTERPVETDVHAIVWSDTMNTSQKIKALAKAGYKNATIVKILNPWYTSVKGRDLRYQHVRNVLMTPTKKG
jgi:hypothetical protein